MLRYKDNERFGPLYLHKLVSQMTNVDSKAARAITQEVTSLTVPSQVGQSIARVAKIFRSTINWLEMVHMLPPDIDAITLKVLETCTVAGFQLFLKTLSTNTALNSIRLDHNTLLAKAEEHYRVLVLSKRWDAVGHQGSSFQLQRPSGLTKNPRARNRIQMPEWNRTAPGNGESHKRDHVGRHFKLCDVCGRWLFGDRGHLTTEHTAGFRNNTGGRSNAPHKPSSGAHNVMQARQTAEDDTDNVQEEPSVSPDDSTDRTSNNRPSVSRLARTYFSGGL